MRERIYRSEALIVRRSDFSEADRLLVLATPAGKRRVVAKGVRKTSSRLAGHIELFTHTALLLAVGRNLDIITQSQVLDSFSALRGDLSGLGGAYYIAELYDKVTEEQEENRPLFDLLVTTFTTLDAGVARDLVLRAYELRLLDIIGYRPQLHRCPICQELLTEEANRFSPTLGGVLCQRDGVADRAALPVQLATFKLLRYLQQQPFEVLNQMQISVGVRQEAETLMRAYLRHVLERDLKSVAFLEETLRSNATGYGVPRWPISTNCLVRASRFSMWRDSTSSCGSAISSPNWCG
ncbi:DNA repair protein RecO [Candidatus Gracilibacteria bacterium]|nr:DNA repair protein RecO [Candidatus Gracilibacteria bacterium]